MRARSYLAAMVALSLILVGCGGNGGEADDTAAEPATTDPATTSGETGDDAAEPATEETPTADDASEGATDEEPAEASDEEPGGESDGEPIRVAIIPTLTGTFAAVGSEIVLAAELAVENANAAGGIDGREVELVQLESDGQPATTLSLVERALEDENAPFITGIISSAESLAIQDRVVEGDGIFLNTTSSADAILAACNERTFSTIPPNEQILNTIGELITESEAESFSIIVPDYATGREQAAGFAERAEAAGKTVNEPIFVPLGTTEYGPQIAQLQDQGADGLFSVLFGGDAIAFTQQAEQFGLLEQYTTLSGYNFVIELTFGAQGEAVEGYLGNFNYYAPVIDTPLNDEFVSTFEAANGAQPTFVAANVYNAFQSLFAGVEAAGSIEPEAVAEALRSTTFETILGPDQGFREGDQLFQRPEFGGQLVLADGGLAWEQLVTPTFEDTAPEMSCG